MRRREFITLVGVAAVMGPSPTRAEQTRKLPIIGFLGPAWSAQDFEDRLRELGWIAGRTVAIEYRSAEGHTERSNEIATEFVRLKVNVIVTVGGSPTLAVKRATSLIPIVSISGDPVGSDLVASLARPDGNATGLALNPISLAGKRLELLREVVPGFRRLSVMVNANSPGFKNRMDEVQAAAAALGLEATILEIRRADDVASAFEALRDRADALYAVGVPLTFAIAPRALSARIPTMFEYREFVDAGGLMSYGVDATHLWRLAATFVDRILRGAKPADLPVQQPTKFDLVINLKTARALGLKVPESFLLRADEVVE
ncbi:ABC transporter substrate-binding protein [Bradyrhizobium japonicum]|uniref:ABC transporter substrate-binding protein n=1 Tax=Bradyrhizobium japonicum TaxID=375 RepID=UPI0004B0F587|nr:ABC transporter substrate-binding protein [Bradyrhizobium japonicum]MCP1767618.1 putative ABC transport system substrate-binding protein [Bradyrhizobium japonicum]MCP1789760.1 putative ABC transport system substrate-binding protein [Bradyrhizobium japonicum]MCP1802256.1 putative ABC transport system substrate-binding protein [Bradyrhizobium japonicum]MCP1820566.1 putative ABC transport system substrate-binding protein [Bradyrhizobium japonicum]MCP1867926.1 putative ABC transport system subs